MKLAYFDGGIPLEAELRLEPLRVRARCKGTLLCASMGL